MTSIYVTSSPPIKNSAFTFFASLISQADTDIFQVNPTLAAGDAKVSIDGGALNNLATLPVVTPAGSKIVKVDLSAAEMNGDEIIVIFSDVAGAEWQDVIFVIYTEVLASATTFPAGAITFTYIVTDITTGLPIEGVEVWFSTDNPAVNIVWKGDTDAFGIAMDVNGNLPSLDAGTYYVWRQKSGFIFTDPDTEVVS
jgi:hypothetical protein